jgi:hypothetical protein
VLTSGQPGRREREREREREKESAGIGYALQSHTFRDLILSTGAHLQVAHSVMSSSMD